MLKTKNFKLTNRHYGFVFLVMIICALGTIFSVSLAYFSGSLKGSSESSNPYVSAKFYYNNTEISANSITGSISEAGVVSLKVGSTTITASSNSFSLPIYIKNVGNVDANLKSLSAVITFKNGSTITAVDNTCGGNKYYLQLSSPNFSITNNNQFEISGTQTLTSGGANSIQILDSLKLNGVITTSELCGKSFVINLSATIAQNGIENLISNI